MPDARNVFAHFLRWQLAAFARLRSLSHLDFKFFGMHQVVGSNTESGRRHLLDLVRGHRFIAVRVGILAAFARIAAPPKLVHCQRERPVRFGTQRAKRHRLRAEALHDGFHGLNFLKQNRRFGNGIKQVAQENRALCFRQFFESGILLGARRLHERVQPTHNFGRRRVKFRAFPETEKPRVRQLFRFGGERRFVHFQVVAKQVIQRFLARIVRRVLEKLLAEVLRKTNNLKEMAVAVACQCRDSHARQHFAQTRMDSCTRLFCAAGLERLRKLVREVWQHRARSGSHEQGHVMRVKHLRRLDDQRHVPQSLAHHGFPHCRRRQQRRQRRARCRDGAIGKEEESRGIVAAQRGSGQLSKTATRPRDSRGGRERKVNVMCASKDCGQLRQLLRRNHRTRQRHSVFQMHFERHHVRLAQRIDRRIRHLRESLLAVVPQSSRQRRQKSRGCVVPHAPVRFFAAKQGGEKNLELILRPPRGPSHAFGVACRYRARTKDLRNLPSRKGMMRLPRRHPLENVAPAQELSGDWIGENHFAGAEPLPLGNPRFLQIHKAGL